MSGKNLTIGQLFDKAVDNTMKNRDFMKFAAEKRTWGSVGTYGQDFQKVLSYLQSLECFLHGKGWSLCKLSWVQLELEGKVI